MPIFVLVCLIIIYRSFINSYEDPVTEKTLTAKAVIQLLIKPGSYQVGSQTIDAISAAIDPRFSNQELEWSIMGRDSTLLYGLLIKLDEADIYHGIFLSYICFFTVHCFRKYSPFLLFGNVSADQLKLPGATKRSHYSAYLLGRAPQLQWLLVWPYF